MNELKAIQDDIKKDKELKKKIQKLMQESANELEKEIRSIIADYEEISLEEHYQRTDKEAIEQMREEVKESKLVSREAAARMGMLYLGFKMSRDKYVENKVDIHTIKTADKQEALMRDHIKESTKRELLRKSKELNLNPKDFKIDDSFFRNTFSELVWRDQKELRNRLINHINQSVAQGKNPKTWAKDLKDIVNKDFKSASYAAERIAITESARAQITLQERLFEEQGIKHWVWVAEPTACPDCAALDGEIFEVGTVDPLPGYIHPFCRCSRSMVD